MRLNSQNNKNPKPVRIVSNPVPTVNDTAGSGASSGKGKLQLKRRKRKMAKKVAEQVITKSTSIKVYTNAWGYEIYVAIFRDLSSKRVSIEIYIVSPDGSMSTLIPIKRQALLKNNACDFLMNYEGDFTRDDCIAVANELKSLLNQGKEYSTEYTKATPKELHNVISNFIRDNAEELEDNPKAECFIKDGFGYMKTTKMDVFIKSEKDNIGYSKRVEILKLLKVMGVLLNAPNRPYDTLVSIKGEKIHYFKIVMAEEMKEEQADEEI